MAKTNHLFSLEGLLVVGMDCLNILIPFVVLRFGAFPPVVNQSLCSVLIWVLSFHWPAHWDNCSEVSLGLLLLKSSTVFSSSLLYLHQICPPSCSDLVALFSQPASQTTQVLNCLLADWEELQALSP